MKSSRLIKALFLVSALLLWQCVFAEVVTEKQARQRAADFFAAAEVKTKASATRPDDFKLVGTLPEAATKASPASAPAMYIFDRPAGGYAIVSGDDVARPVLGYSLSGQFPISDIPDNLRALLQWYADIIDFARQQHWTSSPMAAADGLDPANTVKLQTAQWGQGHPSNDLVEEIEGKKPPIGCVATAIAIVMRYHKWPNKGTGTLPSYDHKYNGITYHVDGITLGHEYNWEKMPENASNCNEEEAEQIARLLYDVAVMCQMDFEPGGSGASSDQSAMRLPKYFDYDNRIRFIARQCILDDGEWERLLVQEIDTGRPVIYSGGRPGGAHAFVIDGYNGHYFSINYGWGGYANGFYTVTPVEGHEEELLLYYSGQSVIYEIMPNNGGSPRPNLVSSSEAILIPPHFSVGKEFYLSLSLGNLAYGSPSLVFCFLLYDRLGSIKERISTSVEVKEYNDYEYSSYVISSVCKITNDLKDGDTIALAAQDAQTGEWIPIRQARVGKIVFTKQAVANLVEIGHIEETIWEKTDLYLKVYKDFCWELLQETRNGYKPILNNAQSFSSEDDAMSIRFYSNGESYDYYIDFDCDTLVYEIWVPTGNYILCVRNPLTNEIMNINLEL